MTLDISADVATFLSEFGEAVTYTKLSGVTRSITAIIDRDQVENFGGVNSLRASITAWVKNDVTAGIAAAELDTGGDTLTLAVRIGQTAAVRRIAALIKHDAGMLQLQLG